MSVVFLSLGRRWEEHQLRHRFHYTDEPGRGFAFPCDPQGIPLPGLSQAALTNYDTCLRLAEAARMVDEGVVDEVQHHYEPPVIQCLRCQSPVTLADAWLSTCSRCGADYNGSGQLLAPRHLWGE